MGLLSGNLTASPDKISRLAAVVKFFYTRWLSWDVSLEWTEQHKDFIETAYNIPWGWDFSCTHTCGKKIKISKSLKVFTSRDKLKKKKTQLSNVAWFSACFSKPWIESLSSLSISNLFQFLNVLWTLRKLLRSQYYIFSIPWKTLYQILFVSVYQPFRW